MGSVNTALVQVFHFLFFFFFFFFFLHALAQACFGLILHYEITSFRRSKGRPMELHLLAGISLFSLVFFRTAVFLCVISSSLYSLLLLHYWINHQFHSNVSILERSCTSFGRSRKTHFCCLQFAFIPARHCHTLAYSKTRTALKSEILAAYLVLVSLSVLCKFLHK
jgi:hypothetical protein